MQSLRSASCILAGLRGSLQLPEGKPKAAAEEKALKLPVENGNGMSGDPTETERQGEFTLALRRRDLKASQQELLHSAETLTVVCTKPKQYARKNSTACCIWDDPKVGSHSCC